MSTRFRHFFTPPFSVFTFAKPIPSPLWTSTTYGHTSTQCPCHQKPTAIVTDLGTIYKISYDLSEDYLKFIARLTYDSDLKRAKISHRNIES